MTSRLRMFSIGSRNSPGDAQAEGSRALLGGLAKRASRLSVEDGEDPAGAGPQQPDDAQGAQEVSTPASTRTYALIVGGASRPGWTSVDSATRAAVALPYDDVTTVVARGLAPDLEPVRSVFLLHGVPTEAVIGVERLHQDYVLLSTATSFQAEVAAAIAKLPVDIVTPRDADVRAIPDLSDKERAEFVKAVGHRLAVRLGEIRAKEQFVLASQIKRLANRAGIAVELSAEFCGSKMSRRP
ncbi:hypothetical protein H4R18_005194 [Coemansia javaensis]|uniref:Uncharacterized protein n=1 Tax=Coemansia javaensis TaxID=2761396 RepID=A0A9W8LF71_9FUNG|nr:hypothetical protein H4R18_005194 [Coemansia javaensis]